MYVDLRTAPVSLRFVLPCTFLILLALCVVSAAAPTAATAAPRSISAVEIQQVRFINQYRRARGLRPLRIDGTLSRAATWMGADMARHGYFGHDDSRGRDPFRRLQAFGYPSNTWRGENVAAGYDGAWSTFKQWRDSPPHRANMVGRNYTSIGIARVHDANSVYGYYWVTEFGSRFTGAPA